MEIIELLDPRVTAVPVRESDDKLVDIKEVSSIRYGDPPESPETAPHYRLLRASVIEKLERAQQQLPDGLLFRLYEGYRHPAFQRKLFLQELERTKTTNPHLDDQQLYLEAAKMVSPVQTFAGHPVTPPHSTGGAADIEIVDSNGTVIEFGMEIRDWTQVHPDFCQSQFQELSQAAAENRKMLISILEAEGFVNYPREWWHFSYGDQYWAFLKNRPYAVYGRLG